MKITLRILIIALIILPCLIAGYLAIIELIRANKKEVKNKLIVVQNQSGGFYKAFLNGRKLTKFELCEILTMPESSGSTLDYWVDEFENKNPEWDIEIREIDVS